MSRENITLSIDELVLDGVRPQEQTIFIAALSQELERLIQDGGVPEADLRAALVRPPALKSIPGETPAAMGVRVAQSIYQGFGAPRAEYAGGRGGQGGES